MIDQSIPDTPRILLDAVFDWWLSEFCSLRVDYRTLFDQKRSPNDSRKDIKNHNWTNAKLTYLHQTAIELEFTIRNKFDVKAVEPSSNQIPGDLPLEERGY